MPGTVQGLEEFVAEMTAAPDREALWIALRDHVRSVVLRAVLYVPNPAVPALRVRARLPAARPAAGPLASGGGSARHPLPRYVDAVPEHGGGDGVAFPLCGAGLRAGNLLAGFGGPAVQQTAADLRAPHCAARIGHVVHDELPPLLRASATLSPRELEVLAWIARDKSNAAIASMMKVSYHTVDTMVGRNFAKLGPETAPPRR